MAMNLVTVGTVAMIFSVALVFCRPPDIRVGDGDQLDLIPLDVDGFLLCTPCMPGWGVKSTCNETVDTVCIPCPSGAWSPDRFHFHKCSPCSKCGDGLYEDTSCTSTSDTKCDLCANTNQRSNPDFVKKCDGKGEADWMMVDVDEDEEDNDQFSQNQQSIGNMDKDGDEQGIFDKYGNGDGELVFNSGMFDDVDLDRMRQRMTEVKNTLDQVQQMINLGRIGESSEEEEEELEEDEMRPHIFGVAMSSGDPEPVEIVDSWEEGFDGKDNPATTNRIWFIPMFTVIACLILLITMIAWRLEKTRKRKSALVSQIVLSKEDREILRKSASCLEEIEKPVKKYQSGGFGYKPLVSGPVSITENPLDSHMNSAV